MGLDFPSSPAAGQVYWPWGGAPAWVYTSGRWARRAGTAERKNRIVNPAMQISQQFGLTYTTVQSTAWHLADQFQVGFYVLGSCAAERYLSPTPGGSQHRISFTVLTSQASPASGNALYFSQRIEGHRCADFQYGTASAKWSVVRFGWNSPAGTYCLFLRSGDGSRTLVSPFTVSAGQANTDLLFIVAIPPDITGSWTPNQYSFIYLDWQIYYNDTVSTPTNTWMSGAYAHSSISNTFMNTVGNKASLFDVGFYLDPNITGLPPPFEVPLYEDDLRDCQRYWYKAYGMRGHITSATLANRLGSPHPVPMRIVPTAVLAGAGLRVYDGGVTPVATAAAVMASAGTDEFFLHSNITAAAGGLTLYRVGGPLVDAQTDNYVAVSARM